MAIKKNNTIITPDFLLSNKQAKNLYHNYAAKLPIIDYHNHLSPKEIAENKKFENLTDIWLKGDHYKWRAMRALGVNEKFITGSSTDEEVYSMGKCISANSTESFIPLVSNGIKKLLWY